MRCQCERCENNEDGYCLNASYVELDENGVCVDMYIKLENETPLDIKPNP